MRKVLICLLPLMLFNCSFWETTVECRVLAMDIFYEVGDGVWNEGEEFTDVNENGVWDKSEPFVDGIEVTYGTTFYDYAVYASSFDNIPDAYDDCVSQYSEQMAADSTVMFGSCTCGSTTKHKIFD